MLADAFEFLENPFSSSFFPTCFPPNQIHYKSRSEIWSQQSVTNCYIKVKLLSSQSKNNLKLKHDSGNFKIKSNIAFNENIWIHSVTNPPAQINNVDLFGLTFVFLTLWVPGNALVVQVQTKLPKKECGFEFMFLMWIHNSHWRSKQHQIWLLDVSNSKSMPKTTHNVTFLLRAHFLTIKLCFFLWHKHAKFVSSIFLFHYY